MGITYDKQPTLIIGLGGIGTGVVDKIYGKIKSRDLDVKAFSIDTDVYTWEHVEHIPKKNFINISSKKTVGEMLNVLSKPGEWFPTENPLHYCRTMAEGSGRVRVVTRLMYDEAVNKGMLKRLLESAIDIAKMCDAKHSRMRIIIVTSLGGGTGSGILSCLITLVLFHLQAKNIMLKQIPMLH